MRCGSRCVWLGSVFVILTAGGLQAQARPVPRVAQPPHSPRVLTPVLDAARRRVAERISRIERGDVSDGARTERRTDVHRVDVPAQAATEASPVWLRLENHVSTRTARAGDPVFFRTTIPVAIGGAAIPAGSAAIGRIVRTQRAGRFRGRAALDIGLLSIRALDGTEIATGLGTASFEQAPGDERRSPLERDSRARLATTVGLAGGYGIAALATRWSDSAETIARAGIAGAIGIGTLVVVMERGADLHLAPGAVVEMTVERVRR